MTKLPARRLHRGLPLLPLLLCLTGIASSQTDTVLFDFDRTGLSTDWKPGQGGAQLSWTTAPVPLPVGTQPPAGNALTVTSPAAGFVYVNAGTLPSSLDAWESMTMWVYLSGAGQGDSADIEIQWFEAGASAKFWRRETLSGAGWHRLSMPLRYFRWSTTRTPLWLKVVQLGIYFRAASVITIDNIGLSRTPGCGADLTTGQLRSLAFPGIDSSTVKTADRPGFRLLTNSASLSQDSLETHLLALVDDLDKKFPFMKDVGTPPVLLAFAAHAEYQQFTPRFATALNATAVPPQSAGYTLQGIATSSWDPTFGSLRPVYTHEFTHSYLERRGLLSEGSWLQEGVASFYQYSRHPEPGLPDSVRSRIAANTYAPIATLCNGSPVTIDRYWQCMTIAGMVLTTQPYAAALPQMFARIYQRGSCDITPLVDSVFSTTMAQFTEDWIAYCQSFPASAATSGPVPAGPVQARRLARRVVTGQGVRIMFDPAQPGSVRNGLIDLQGRILRHSQTGRGSHS